MVVVDKSSKFLCGDDKEREEQVRDHLIANEKTIEIPAENDNLVKGSKMEDILRGSNTHMESAKIITFYPNTVKNEPMWHSWMIFRICAKHQDLKMSLSRSLKCKWSTSHSCPMVRENWPTFWIIGRVLDANGCFVPRMMDWMKFLV